MPERPNLKPVVGSVPDPTGAERALLGLALIAKDVAETVAAELDPDAFSEGTPREVARAIGAAIAGGGVADAQLLIAEMARAGTLESAGGGTAVADLIGEATVSGLVPEYMRIVREAHDARRLGDIATAMTAPGYHDPVERASWATERLADIGAHNPTDDTPTALLEALYARLDAPDAKAMWGLADLDDITGGLRPGSLIVVAARTSVGKTSLATLSAVHNARSMPVVFGSWEMTLADMAGRLMAAIGPAPLSECDEVKAAEPADALAKMTNLRVWELPGETAEQFSARVRLVHGRTPLGLVVADHLHEVPWQHYKLDAHLGIAEACRVFKRLALSLNVPVMLCAQLNRSPEGRPDKRPTLADLRQSGAIEEVADVVVLLHRPHLADKDKDPMLAIADVAKNRHGPKGDVELHWHGARATFGNRVKYGFGGG